MIGTRLGGSRQRIVHMTACSEPDAAARLAGQGLPGPVGEHLAVVVDGDGVALGGGRAESELGHHASIPQERALLACPGVGNADDLATVVDRPGGTVAAAGECA